MTNRNDDDELDRLLQAWTAPKPSAAWLDKVARNVQAPRISWRLTGSLGAAVAAGGLIGFLAPAATVSTAAAADITTLGSWIW